MTGKLIITAILLGAWSTLEYGYNLTTPLIVGDAAGTQLDSSDSGYFAFNMINHLMTKFNGVIDFAVLVILLVIWVPYIVKQIKNAA